MLRRTAAGVAIFALLVLTGCGTYTPRKSIYLRNSRDEHNNSLGGKLEINLISHIKCEVQNAIYDVDQLGGLDYLGASWGTQVTLNLTWDEMSGFNPSVSFLNPMAAMQAFEIGVGGSATAHATRKETITFLWENRQLLQAVKKDMPKLGNKKPDCSQLPTGMIIDSDLLIGEFIYDKAVVAKSGVVSSVDPKIPPFSAFQEDLTFVGSFGGHITPTWKLTRFTSNTANDLLSATRTTTGDILITLGPLATEKDGSLLPKLGEISYQEHIAGIISGAVASQARSLSR